MFGYLVSLVVLVFLVTIVLCWDSLPQEQTYGAVLARWDLSLFICFEEILSAPLSLFTCFEEILSAPLSLFTCFEDILSAPFSLFTCFEENLYPTFTFQLL